MRGGFAAAALVEDDAVVVGGVEVASVIWSIVGFFIRPLQQCAMVQISVGPGEVLPIFPFCPSSWTAV